MATRNINVVISANIRRYTDGLKSAATATRNFQSQVSRSGQVAATTSQQVQKAAASSRMLGSSFEHNAKQATRLSAALTNGNRAMRDASQVTGAYNKSLTFMKSAAVQAVAALGGFMAIHAVIMLVRKGLTFLKDAVLDFDTAIVESMAIMSQQGPAVRAALEDSAQGLAMKTKFTSTEIAEGFYHLVSAGYDLNETLALTPVVAQYAQAGVMDLEKATEQLAQTQAALGMRDFDDAVQNGENMARIADVLSQAAVKSTATVSEFGDALTNKFGTAVALSGRSVEEAATILMAYANVGIKGKIAGTQAAIALRDLQKAAIINGSAMEEMGVHVYDAYGNLNNLVDIAREMGKSFGALSDKGLRNRLKSLGFADRSVHALLPLIATSTEEWNKNEAAMNGAAGAARRMADKQMVALSTQLGLVSKAAEEAAQKIGTSIINQAFKVWEDLKEPISEVVKNLKEFATQAAIPAAMPLIKTLGGTLLVTLKVAAEALSVFSGVLNALGPALVPIATMAIMFKGLTTVFTPLAISAQVFAGKLGLISQAQMTNAAATRSATAALTQQAAAQEAYVAQNALTQAGGQAGFIGPMLPTTVKSGKFAGMGGKIATSFKGAASSVKGTVAQVGLLGATSQGASLAATKLSTAINMIGKGTAIMAAVAALVAMGIVIDKNIQKGRQWADEQTAGMNSGLNMGDPADRQKAIDNQREQLEALKKERDKTWNDSEGINPWSGLQNAFTSNALSKAIDQTRNNIERDSAKMDLYEERIARIARITGTTEDVVRTKVDAMGIGQELYDATAKSEEYSKIQGDVTLSLYGVENRAASAGMSVQALAAEEGDGAAAAEEMQKAHEELAKVLFAGMDPTKILSDIGEVNKAMSSAFGGSGSSVLSDLQSQAEDAASAAADAAKERSDQSIDDRIEALQDEKDALEVGTKASKASKDAIKARKEAIDDEIDSIRDGKQDKKEFESEPAKVGLESWVAGLQKASEDSQALTNNLLVIKQKMRDAGMPESVVTDTIKNLSEMGAEGAPLIEQFATMGEARFGQMAIKISESFKGINPEIKTSLDDFDRAMAEQSGKADQQIVGLIEVTKALSAAGQATTVDDLLAFARLGPEAMALVPEMAMKAASGPEGAAAVAQTIRNALGAAGMMDGSIVPSLKDELLLAQAAAANGGTMAGQAINEMLRQEMISTPGEMANELAARGMNEAAKYAQGWEFYMALWNAENNPGPQNVTNGSSRAEGTPSKPSGGRRTPQGSGSQLPNVGKPLNGIDPNPGGGIDGNIWTTYANGGFSENHRATIARAGAMRVWAEPETGGEAYIPLGSNKRNDAMPVLAEVARRFGMGLTQYANGGIRPAGYDMVGAGRHGTGYGQGGPRVVAVPVQSKSVTNFNGPIQGVRMEDAEAFAARKRRQSRLAGGKR